MNSPRQPGIFPRRRDWWWLAAGLLLLFVFCLGSRGLNEPDEGRYAIMGRAMAQPGGDWWEPRLSGYAHYDKPPILYWVTALSFRAFGFNEWAARVPPLLGAVLALLGLGWAAWRLRGERVAWWAVLICGTSVQFWIVGRILSPDMLLTGWCALAIGAWAECRHRGGAWRFWWLSLGFWTLAWWTKATPALIPLAGLAAGTRLTGDLAGRRALRIGWMLPAIILLGSPWYLSMLGRYPELRRFFFGRELAGRIAGKVDGRHGAVFYYLPVSLVAWLPWWPLAAWAVWRERTRLFAGPAVQTAREWSRRIGVEGWIVGVGLIIFSLAGSKLPTYSLTLAPWAALGMARLLAGTPEKEPSRFPTRLLWPAGGFVVFAVCGVLLPASRYESKLGVNSSLRSVAAYLRAHGAAQVDSDHYWAGMEFYLPGRQVRHVIHIDTPGENDPLPPGVDGPPVKNHPRTDEHHRERASDPGLPPLPFIDPAAWKVQTRLGGHWLVRFRRNRDSPFDSYLQTLGRETGPRPTRIGDFDLYFIPPP